MPKQLVQSDSELALICTQIAAAEHVAVDTEFIRQRTFKAQLCLVQIAVNDQIYCIDPLAIGDLAPLMDALLKTQIVIHSARQDIEVIFQTTGYLLAPIFDTQIAAGLTGIGDQISYSALVSELLGVDLGKGETRTNWAQRPLSDAQIEYAQDDVRYLLQLYAPLYQRLSERNRVAWHQSECLHLGQQDLYELDPAQAWKKVKGTRLLRWPQRRAMKRLAAWREIQADVKDKPRKWIISDEDIVNIASQQPATADEVSQLFDDKQRFLKNQSDEILSILIQAEDDPVEERLAGADDREIKLTKKCMALIRRVAEQHDLSPALLGTRKDLQKVLQGEPSQLLEDWRLELVGQKIQKILAETP